MQEPEDQIPKAPLSKEDTLGVVVLAALLIGLWIGGTVLAHYIWAISWIVAAAIVPAAAGVGFALIKLMSRSKTR
ncbi:MAG: hypothetical protein HY898_09135 [Deltaproteobacteria bacterium]|nr:hypothetical protein [Deltaproteobacteria bacterium]